MGDNQQQDPSTDQVTVTNQGVDKSPTVSIVNEQEPLPGEIDPESLDPNLHYRFVREVPQQMAKRLGRGYRFVTEEDGVKKLYEEGGDDKGDGRIRHNDTVLMAIPKELHEEQQARVQQVSRSRLAAPKGQFRKKAKQAGVPINDKPE